MSTITPPRHWPTFLAGCGNRDIRTIYGSHVREPRDVRRSLLSDRLNCQRWRQAPWHERVTRRAQYGPATVRPESPRESASCWRCPVVDFRPAEPDPQPYLWPHCRAHQEDWLRLDSVAVNHVLGSALRPEST